jgi:type IV secretory pathway TrbL component
MAERNRRKIVVAWTGTGAAVLLGAAAVAGLSMAGSGTSPTATTAGASSSARSSAHSAGAAGVAHPMGGGPPSPIAGDDVGPQAVAYLRQKDPAEKVAGHVQKVVQSGNYLRVYTDLPESDENSQQAISLCEWTAEYLAQQRGSKDPVVFIHAKKSDNGNVVIANKQDTKDDCTVGRTR